MPSGIYRCVHGYIAQWLERLTADQQVPGSNPGVPSFLLIVLGQYDDLPATWRRRATTRLAPPTPKPFTLASPTVRTAGAECNARCRGHAPTSCNFTVQIVVVVAASFAILPWWPPSLAHRCNARCRGHVFSSRNFTVIAVVAANRWQFCLGGHYPWRKVQREMPRPCVVLTQLYCSRRGCRKSVAIFVLVAAIPGAECNARCRGHAFSSRNFTVAAVVAADRLQFSLGGRHPAVATHFFFAPSRYLKVPRRSDMQPSLWN